MALPYLLINRILPTLNLNMSGWFLLLLSELNIFKGGTYGYLLVLVHEALRTQHVEKVTSGFDCALGNQGMDLTLKGHQTVADKVGRYLY